MIKRSLGTAAKSTVARRGNTSASIEAATAKEASAMTGGIDALVTPAGASAATTRLATPPTDQAPIKAHWKAVRDRFKMPPEDFARIDTLKQRSLSLQRPAKKSELLRAGLLALTRLPDADFFDLLGGIVVAKAGPNKKRR